MQFTGHMAVGLGETLKLKVWSTLHESGRDIMDFQRQQTTLNELKSYISNRLLWQWGSIL